MGPTVTPSPTPPADGILLPSTPMSMMSRVPDTLHIPGSDGSWRYSTPPLEEYHFYDYGSPSPYPPQHIVLPSSYGDSNGIGQSPDIHSHIRGISDSCLPKLRLRASDMQVSRSRRSTTSRPRSNTKTRGNEGRVKKNNMTDQDRSTPQTKQKSAPHLNIPVLDKPLSEWAKELSHVKVENIEEYVNRSLKERHQEAAGAGKIKRELNPFLLYRKAHKNIAEALIRMHSDDDSHINPRISKLCGNSWKPMESPAFRAQYEKWSKIEKDRLKKAFPDYRYQPNKKQREEDFGSPVDSFVDSEILQSQERNRRTRSYTPFSQHQTPPRGQHASPWVQDYGSPTNMLSMDYTPEHLSVDPSHHGLNVQGYMGSPAAWDTYREAMSQSPAPPVSYQLHPMIDHRHQATSIDPQLFGGNDYSRAIPEEPKHVSAGQYLLSAPDNLPYSRAASGEPLGQGWAASVPGCDHYDYIEGGVDDWELGTGDY